MNPGSSISLPPSGGEGVKNSEYAPFLALSLEGKG
jgi:hypothetical protein